MRILGLVTARGGSKGVPGKNVRPLAGKPLIGWTIEAAKAAKSVDRVVLSTDSEEIASVARAFGASVPFLRPAAFAQDDSSHVSVVTHALDWLEREESYRPTHLLLLQPTSPLRSSLDIEGAAALARQGALAVVGVSVAESHPYLTKRMDPQGLLSDFVSSDIAYKRRQDLPPAYAVNGAIYLLSVAQYRARQDFTPPGAVGYVMPRERSIDIDELLDFQIAESIILGRA